MKLFFKTEVKLATIFIKTEKISISLNCFSHFFLILFAVIFGVPWLIHT